MTESPDHRSSRAGPGRKAVAIRGGEAVRTTFSAALTRRRYAELVGVSVTTVRRWEMARIVKPTRQTILGSPTNVFTVEDVDFGRRLIALLRRRSGVVSLEDAARIVRHQARP